MNLPANELFGLAWSQVWQVTLLLAVVGVLTRVFCRRRPHLAYLLWMLVVLKCLTPPLWSSPTGVFSWAQARSDATVAEERLPVAEAAPAGAKIDPFARRMLHPEKRSSATSTPIVAKAAAAVETTDNVDRPEPVRDWNVSWTAIAASIWMLGVVALGGVLLWKWMAFGRVLRRSGRAADAELALLAARVGERLGLRRAVAVRIVSGSIGPAVFGLWRPVVVLPETLILSSPFERGAEGEGNEALDSAALTLTLSQRAWGHDGNFSQRERGHDGEPFQRGRGLVCLRQIEPILAHELAHVRRGDAFAGLLQMIAQVVWWFHPLVWWASREMCRRREQCCDEEVVAGLGCSSAVYARCLVDVLEWECCRGRRRLLSVVPGVGSAEITTTRLEHIMDDAKRFHRRTPRWMWAVLALAIALVLPGREMVLGQSSKALSTKDTKGTKDGREGKGEKGNEGKADWTPTPTEIANANDATWNAIRTMDMEYTQTSRYMYSVMGNKRWIEDTVTGRWLKAGNQERLKRSSKHDYYDYYIDDVAERELCEPHRKEADYGRFSPVDVTDVGGRIYPAKSRILARRLFFSPSPEVLRYFYLYHGDFKGDLPLTLAETCAAWKVKVKEKTLSAAGDTLWLLHANYPGKYHNTADSYVDFYVNANKGFLVEKAFIYESNSCIVDGRTVGRFHSIEIKEYQVLDGGIFFPKRMEYRKQVGIERAEQISADKCDWSTWTVTKLRLNAPLASDAFDFRFPAGVTVYENDKLPNEYKVYIWGADNKPAKKFASEREYLKPKYAQHFEKMRQKVEKTLASKKPQDVAERVEYYMSARKYDEAIAACSQWIAARPTPEEKAKAVYYRGMAYLVKQDYDKAIVDFTETMRLAEKPDDKDGVCLYRALAYAGRDETLDKALSDLAKIESIAPQAPDDFGCYWASLLRAAVRIRRLHTDGAVQDKAQAQRDVVAIVKDIEQAMHISQSREALALMVYLLDGDKSSSTRTYVASLREMGKRQPKIEFPLDDGSLMVDVDAVVGKCLVRLVPGIERDLKAMRKGDSPKP